MTNLTFHILDALSRDQIMTITRETEEEQEVEIDYEDDNPDISYGKANTQKQQRGIVIHLFGMTTDGESLRCDVEGFRPFFYVEVPASLNIQQFRDQLSTVETARLQVPPSLSIERVNRK